MILVLFLLNAGLLTLSTELLDALNMKGYVMKRHGEPKLYKRRLDMAHQLVKETGRKDWAIKIGLINEAGQAKSKEMREVHVEAIQV